MSAKELANFYRNEWPGPDEFSWNSLRYRLLSYDVVLVEGGFYWKDSTSFTQGARGSYTGVLVKDRGQFKIRLEMEFPKDLNLKINPAAVAESQSTR